MLTELCQELHNWFDRDMPKIYGKFTVEDGVLWLNKVDFEVAGDGSLLSLDNAAPLSDVLQDGQYYRIVGSVFNDGVHKFADAEDVLTDEREFEGSVWGMSIPKSVIALADDIAAWQAKYGNIDSAAMSPYTSESFGGYSYSKNGGGAASGSGSGGTWESVFAGRMNRWRKLH